jgi:hypothetical protein
MDGFDLGDLDFDAGPLFSRERSKPGMFSDDWPNTRYRERQLREQRQRERRNIRRRERHTIADKLRRLLRR